MIRLTERSHIPAPPQRIWAWFEAMEGHYRDWHPEHIEWRTLRGTPVTAGSVIFFDEWIGRFRLAMRCRIAESQPGRCFRYEGLWPFWLVRAGGSFMLEPVAGGSDLIAEVHIGWSVPLVGSLLDRLIASVFPLSELKRHMAEEGRNLARILNK